MILIILDIQARMERTEAQILLRVSLEGREGIVSPTSNLNVICSDMALFSKKNVSRHMTACRGRSPTRLVKPKAAKSGCSTELANKNKTNMQTL
jgi:hypothetical protein